MAWWQRKRRDDAEAFKTQTERGKEHQRRWLVIVGGILLLVVLAQVVFQAGRPPTRKPKQQTISLVPEDIREKSDLATARERLDNLERRATRLEDDVQSLRAGQGRIRGDIENLTKITGGIRQAMKMLADDLRELREQMATLPPPGTAPVGEPAPIPEGGIVRGSGTPEGGGSVTPPPVAGTDAETPQPPPVAPPPPAASGGGQVPPPPAPPGFEGGPALAGEAGTGGGPLVFTPEGSEKLPARRIVRRNPYAGWIPAGSLVPAALLTGVEAGTASTAQANPEPVLIRIQQAAILPNDARYRLDGCFAIGSAYGSLASERAYIRLASISCVDRKRHLLLEGAIRGYVVDSDGIFGLRGKVIERRGALLGKSLLAGFVGGLSKVFGMAQGTTAVGPLGAVSEMSSAEAVRGAGLMGAANAADRLAQFYLQEAESIFPVIEVPPGRKITVVVTQGGSLKWQRYRSQYLKTFQPQGLAGRR